MWVMTNYKVRAAGNDNMVLFQIRGFPADSLIAGLDILEKSICCWGQLRGRMNFLCHVENLPACHSPTSETCHWRLSSSTFMWFPARLAFHPQCH